MEKLLTRLARQLDAIDEASLMSLWSKYATAAGRFEPTKRWEEAALIFSLIQAKRWKNQLFNYYWSQQSQAREDSPADAPENLVSGFELENADRDHNRGESPSRRCRVLPFKGAKPAPDTDH